MPNIVLNKIDALAASIHPGKKVLLLDEEEIPFLMGLLRHMNINLSNEFNEKYSKIYSKLTALQGEEPE